MEGVGMPVGIDVEVLASVFAGQKKLNCASGLLRDFVLEIQEWSVLKGAPGWKYMN